MVVDVSSEARMLRGYEEGDRRRELVTRDLLGGNGAVLGSTVVDLELKVPAGWERRLDLSVCCLSSYVIFFSIPYGYSFKFEFIKCVTYLYHPPTLQTKPPMSVTYLYPFSIL